MIYMTAFAVVFKQLSPTETIPFFPIITFQVFRLLVVTSPPCD